MKILITGATGLVGMKLLETLSLKGHFDIRVLTRNVELAKEKIPFPVELYLWNPEKKYLQSGALENVAIIIHLAGENIATGRWSEKKKKKILESRILGSQLLIDEIKKMKEAPLKLIFSSAVGIYGNSGDQIITDHDLVANDYLAMVCKAQEDAILNNNIPKMKVHGIRTGVVLADSGGALQQMLPAFQAGIAGIIGNGRQYISWIHIDDLINQFIFLIENQGQYEIYNGTAPHPVTNFKFTKELGSILKRPTLFPLPAFLLKFLFGEMANVLLNGQRVIPQNFLNQGLIFKFEKLSDALNDILKFKIRAETVLKKYQWVDRPVESVFSFFSDENNLEKITPPYLNFKILNKNTPKITVGTKINYRLKIHGIPIIWKSLITHFEENKTFTDLQQSGPYTKWVHRHDFIKCLQGTLIKDEIVYKLPLGAIGKFFAGYFVNNDLKKIFNHRKVIINNQFK